MDLELTPRITELYNSIQKGIQRYAMWVQDAIALYNICQVPGDYLEIGTYFGGSAILASKAKTDAGIRATVFCVDPLDGDYSINKLNFGVPSMQALTGNFDKFNVENAVIFQGKTPPLPSGTFGMMFSTVFIDGNHKGSGPTDDWLCVKDRVLPGGRVMFHDVHYEDVQRAVYLANKEPGWKSVAHYLVKGVGMPSQMQVEGNELYGSYAILEKL